MQIERDTAYVTRVIYGVLDQPVFTLDLKKNVLRISNSDGHIEIKQADIAALLALFRTI